ncbi:MAG: hypothetical protein PHT19_17620 [Methylococcus sp.]|nr:hypothetical protein [Methylococcus sp.]
MKARYEAGVSPTGSQPLVTAHARDCEAIIVDGGFFAKAERTVPNPTEVRELNGKQDRAKNNGPLQKGGPHWGPSVLREARLPTGYPVTGSKPVAVTPIGSYRGCGAMIADGGLVFNLLPMKKPYPKTGLWAVSNVNPPCHRKGGVGRKHCRIMKGFPSTAI